jgi:histidine phosphotransferase ChpT
MSQSIDLRLLELLCARLCHDLVGPVSAIGNGVELVTEFGEDMKGEALGLIAQSASEAARRLQFFRIAFGSAAGSDGRALPLTEAWTRARELPLGGRVVLDWPEPKGVEFDRLALKLLLNLFLIAVDASAGNGTVKVRIEGNSFKIFAESPKANCSEETRLALSGDLSSDQATPKTAVAIHAYLLASGGGLAIDVAQETGRVTLSVRRK